MTSHDYCDGMAPSDTPNASSTPWPSKGVFHGHPGFKIVRTCTIHRSAGDLYSFWHNPENLMQVVNHPITITNKSGAESHWSLSAPLGRHVEWDSVLINDKPDRLIAWRSREGAQVPNAGTIRFEPVAGNGDTDVTIALEFAPTGGRLGTLAGRLGGGIAEKQVADTLRRFKNLMESNSRPTDHSATNQH